MHLQEDSTVWGPFAVLLGIQASGGISVFILTLKYFA